MNPHYHHTVDVVHYSAGGTSTRGNPTLTETGRDTWPALLQQRRSAEDESLVVDLWDLHLPGAAVISAGDEVIEGSRRFTVEGTPDFVRVRGGIHHVEVLLRYVGEVPSS